MIQVSCAKKFYLPFEFLSGLRKEPRDPLLMKLLSHFFDATSTSQLSLQDWASRMYVAGTWPHPHGLNCSGPGFKRLEHDLRTFAASRFEAKSDSSFVAQYRAQLNSFYYDELLPSQPDLYDIAPARPMSFCLSGT